MIEIKTQAEFDAAIDAAPVVNGRIVCPSMRITGDVVVRRSLTVYCGTLRVDGGGRLNVNGGTLTVDGGTIRVYRGTITVDGGTLRVFRGKLMVDGKEIASGEIAAANLRIVATAALASQESLEMFIVYTCSTTHSMPGWACALLPGGKELEQKVGWHAAGLALLGVEASRYFFASNESARRFLQGFVDRAK